LSFAVREVLLPDLLIRIDDSAFAWCNATVCAREDAIVPPLTYRKTRIQSLI
jgi:hypothetical protein